MINREMTVKQKLGYIFRPTLYMRPVIAKVRENKHKNMVGAEIGVAGGIHAYNILRVLPMKKLYLIDPYEYDKICYKAKNLLHPFNKKIEFIRQKSYNAINSIPDNLDFVYIDGDHSYYGVRNDFSHYYPKVKNGGIIGGHDFNIRTMGVVYFVLELHKSYGRNVFVKGNDWWLIK